MLEFLILLLVLGGFIWIYIVDRRTTSEHPAAPPVIHVTVNIDGNRQQTTTSSDPAGSSASQKRNEIPMETPSRTKKSWKDIKITDSFNG